MHFGRVTQYMRQLTNNDKLQNKLYQDIKQHGSAFYVRSENHPVPNNHQVALHFPQNAKK